MKIMTKILGFGSNMYPLVPGVDCPLSATYLGTTNNDDYGMPYGVPGTICIFERSIGDPAWRHYELFAQTPEQPLPAEGRAATELVVRYVATVGNYDVGIFWFFMYITSSSIQRRTFFLFICST
jgi:primary-amine oxidase